MKQHTHKPWSAAEVANDSDTFVKVCHANGGTIAKLWIDVDDREFSDEQRENARRIVACVNACRGLPTDELEQKGLVAAIGTPLLDVEQQRDGWQTALGTVLATIPDAEIIRASGTVGDAVAYFTQLHQQRDELLAALAEIDGCFEAALIEWWLDAVADEDVDRIKDIYCRRIDYARGIAVAALSGGAV